VLFSFVILWNGRSARWQLNPRLLGFGEDVDVRRQQIWVVEGSDPNEPDH
jgi:hypothetical protein